MSYRNAGPSSLGIVYAALVVAISICFAMAAFAVAKALIPEEADPQPVDTAVDTEC